MSKRIKQIPSLRKNAIYNMVYQIITIITPLITSPYLSRILGPDGIGTFSYSQSIANYFFLFSMLGVNNYGNRMIAQNRDNRKNLSETFWQIYYMQMMQACIFCILYVLTCFFVIESRMRTIFLIQGLQIVSVFFDVNWFAFGLEQFKFTTIRNIFVKFISLFSIFAFVKNQNDVWKYALIVVLGTIIGLLAVWPLIFIYTDFQVPQIQKVKVHFKPNLVLFVPYIASSIFQYMDKIMLGAMWNTESVGFYTYAENILNVPLGITSAICTVCMPRVSNLYSTGKIEYADNLLNRVNHYLMILNVALCCGIIVVAPKFVPLYLGENYKMTGKLLQILAIILPISGCASAIRMLFLIPYGKDKIYVYAVVTGAIVNLIGNTAAIPYIGAIGACLMTLIANLAVLLMQVILTRKEKPYKEWLKKDLLYFAIGIVMMLVVKIVMGAIHNNIIAMIVGIISGAFFYVIVSSSVLLLYEKDSFAWEMWNKCKKVLRYL